MTAGFGLLAGLALLALVLCTWAATLFVRRLQNRDDAGDEPAGEIPRVLRKVKRRESLTEGELTLARRVIGDRRSPLAFAIPAGVFSIGLFYVLASLEQLHGATPSERTFLGVIPMISATNMTVQLLKSGRLKRRLPTAAAP